MSRSRHDGCGGPCFLCSRPSTIKRRLARAPQLADQLDAREQIWLDLEVADDRPEHALYRKLVEMPEEHWRDVVDDLLDAEDDWRTFKREMARVMET